MRSQSRTNQKSEYKKNVIPGDSKPYTLRLPQNYISTFIDQQDTIYVHRADELFKNRKTIAIRDNTPPSATRGKAVVGNGKLVYHKISSGETLGSIAEKYKVRVKDIQNWNGLRNTKITAGKRLKIYK